MRKVCSILLVVLIAVNISGYYLISISLSVNDTRQSQKLLNNEFSGSDAIIIKLPLSVPYSGNDDQYKIARGKFTYNHETYRIVKKRLMNDRIYIVCVRDKVEDKIRGQMNDVAKSFSNSPLNQKHSTKTLSFIKDYLPVFTSLENGIDPWTQEIISISFSTHYNFQFKSNILQPPRA